MQTDIDKQRLRSLQRTLHVLLVISFVITGSQLFWEVLGVAGLFPAINNFYSNAPSQYSDVFSIKMEQEMAIPQWYNLLRAFLDLTSLFGLVLMWRLRKNGFHAYTLSKLLLMLLPLLFLDRSYVAFGDIMLAVLFIVYYFFLLKNLGAFDGVADNGSLSEKADDTDDPSVS